MAAVTVPCGLTKAALSFAICSGVDTRMPLSLLTVVTFLLPAERGGREREGEEEGGREIGEEGEGGREGQAGHRKLQGMVYR